MRKIKVKLIGDTKSSGRGMGFYHDQLAISLDQSNKVELVESNEDLVHYTYYAHFNAHLPLFTSKPSVLTIHDLTPIVLKELYPTGVKGAIYHWLQKRSAKSMSSLITDSYASKKDLISLYRIPQEKIFVTHLAAKDIFFKEISDEFIDSVLKKYKLDRNFVLTVSGGPNKNKNLVRLAEACLRANKTLVIVGKGMVAEIGKNVHIEMTDLVALRKYRNVVTPGFVDDQELVALYKACLLYCQASLYEGFGLPLLESMAAGSVAISSNTSSLPEIFDTQELQFDPYSIEQIVEKINAVSEFSIKERTEQSLNNIKRAKTFSWKKTAMETIDAYMYALENESK